MTTAIDPVNQGFQEYPLILNTGRIRDQWHTMSRTDYLPISAHIVPNLL